MSKYDGPPAPVPRPGMDPKAPPSFNGPAHDRQEVGPDDPSAKLQHSAGYEDPRFTIERFGPFRYGQIVEIITRSDRKTGYDMDVTVRVNGNTVLDMSHCDGVEFLKRLEVALSSPGSRLPR